MKANDTPSMTSNEIYARVKENEFANTPTHRVNVIDGNGVIRLSRPCWGLDMAESIAANREGEIDGWTVEIVEQENRDEIQAYWDKENTEPDNTPTAMNANETISAAIIGIVAAGNKFNNQKRKDMETTLTNRVNIARRITASAAALKDWRIRNKHNRAMREMARELTSGKGYIIASVRELAEKYGKLCHYETTAPDADVKHVWGLQMNCVWRKIQFVAI